MTAIEIDLPALVALDLYKDIHKGIRAELFGATLAAGAVDPEDRAGRHEVAARIRSIAAVLESHAHHEDVVIEPALTEHLPWLAEEIHADHERLEARFARVVDLAGLAAVAPAADRRRLTHLLYLDLGAFTSSYLAHQDTEERVVMPALQDAVGVPAVVAMHQAIVGSIAPAEMAQSLAFMLPAMNADDQAELIGGMQQGAPPEVVEGVLALAQDVLGRRFDVLLARLSR